MKLEIFQRSGRDRASKSSGVKIREENVNLTDFRSPADLYSYVQEKFPSLKLHYIVRHHQNADPRLFDVLPNTNDTSFWSKKSRLAFVDDDAPGNDVLQAVLISRPQKRFDKDYYTVSQSSGLANADEELSKLLESGGEEFDRKTYGDGTARILFATSRRPYFAMNQESTENCKVSKESVNFWLPVSRYPGLYFNSNWAKFVGKEETQYCGTFYFYEPDSTLYLDLGNSPAVFASKTHAAEVLQKLIDQRKLDLKLPSNVYHILNWQTPRELLKYEQNLNPNYRNVDVDYVIGKSVGSVSDSWDEVEVDDQYGILPFYPIDPSPFFFKGPPRSWNMKQLQVQNSAFSKDYIKPIEEGLGPGDEDYLDQQLCYMARLFGISTLILQSVESETRASTEILDPRPWSYAFLCRKSPLKYPPLLNKDEYYGTIWFPKTQGLVMMDPDTNKPIVTMDFWIDKSNFNSILPAFKKRKRFEKHDLDKHFQ